MAAAERLPSRRVGKICVFPLGRWGLEGPKDGPKKERECNGRTNYVAAAVGLYGGSAGLKWGPKRAIAPQLTPVFLTHVASALVVCVIEAGGGEPGACKRTSARMVPNDGECAWLSGVPCPRSCPTTTTRRPRHRCSLFRWQVNPHLEVPPALQMLGVAHAALALLCDCCQPPCHALGTEVNGKAAVW